MNSLKILCASAVTALTLASTSCGIYKKYETPSDTPLTKAYVDARSQAVDSSALGNLLWEDVFTDPVLVDLIDRALVANNSLTKARLNIDIAKAQLQGAKLAYFPSVALAPNGAGASYAGSKFSWSYQIPATVSWEVDIFGKLLNSKRGAKVAVEQSEAYAQAVRSQIISAVASTYYSIASVEAQLELMRNTAVLWERSVQTMRDLKDAGRPNMTEAGVVQTDANYRSVLASIADLEATRHELNNTMSLLLNTMPQQWEVSPSAALDIPVELNNGVMMSYLAQRPDVAAAERALAVAFYATNSARAAFYPGLNITANGGFTNLLGSMIKNPGEWFVQLAGQLTAPLFSRGQNIARLKAARIQQTQALNDFEYALLSAAGEVSDALTLYNKSIERQKHLKDQVQDLEKSVEYTNDLLLYANGTYLEVITAQQSLLQAQMNLLSNRLTGTRAIIDLYRALGGGR